MNTYVLPLADSHADLAPVGGKGRSLTKMINAGFPVPDGFLVNTEAYRQFVTANNLQTKIIAALKDVDISLPAILETVTTTIARIFTKVDIPEDIAATITGLLPVIRCAPAKADFHCCTFLSHC